MRLRKTSRKHTVSSITAHPVTHFDRSFLFSSLAGRLAIKYHPDKNRDDPRAEERFKEIAIAYQTLSDETLRRKYNEFGPKESAPEGGFVDPEEVFSVIFGGERFVPIIGNISLGHDMKTALQEAEENQENDGKAVVRDAKGREILSPEEKAKRDEKNRKVAAEVRLSRSVSPSKS
jgi:DnaJ-class molecular chaperone